MAASPSTARAINDRLALELLQEEGPLTAGQLKTLTGLSRPTVADLVERLQGSGLVRIVGETGGRRRGPNARLYGLVADRAHLAALDVRTQSVAVVVSDLLGATLAEAVLPIGSDTGVEPAVEGAAALLERTARDAGAVRLHSVGIGAPGLIDPVTGELRETSGVPAWHRRLVAALQERLSATVLVENETNLAAVAEQRVGAARDQVTGTFVLLWLGFGVGAALVLDGKVRRGASGGAGEIGFLPVPGTSGLPSSTGCDGGSTRWPARRPSANSPRSTACSPTPAPRSRRRRPSYAPPSRRVRRGTPSSTRSPRGSRSAPPPSAPYSTRAGWSWRARSARRAVRRWLPGSRPAWRGCPPPYGGGGDVPGRRGRAARRAADGAGRRPERPVRAACLTERQRPAEAPHTAVTRNAFSRAGS